MNNATRKPLEDWQIQDAARLRKIFGARATLNQSDFGAEYALGSQGAVWQYLNGHIPLNLAAALKFAKGLGVRVADFSPTLAKQLGDVDRLTSPNGLIEAVHALPDDTQQEVLDFIRYKFERADTVAASEKTAHYLAMIDRITADMARRKTEDAGKKRPPRRKPGK